MTHALSEAQRSKGVVYSAPFPVALGSSLDHCELCPRRCGANRAAGERGICGAGLDVLANEKEPNRALIEHERCIVTPHAAFNTAEANDTLRRMTLKAMVEALVFDREPENVVRV